MMAVDGASDAQRERTTERAALPFGAVCRPSRPP